MARSYPDQLGPGAYSPTSEVFDPAFVERLNVTAPEFKEFLNKLARVINDMNLLLNQKDTALYPLQEFVNSQLFFPDPTLTSSSSRRPVQRNVFRKVINFGTLPNNGTTSVAHGLTIDSNWSFTRMYGCSTNPNTAFVPIPNQDIKLSADTTNVTITTTAAYAGYTVTYVVLEFIKQ
jgi:hypothetical protein